MSKPEHNPKGAATDETPAPQVWRFDALDTWFFRESRPLDSVGGAQLGSQFPPPARTLIGAIRTTVGDTEGADWRAYRDDPDHPLRTLIGTPDTLQPLRFQGPFLMKDGQRLYPAPLVLMRAEGRFTRLQPSDTPVECDLGRVRLPRKREALAAAKPLEGAWLTRAGLQAVLQGQDPAPADVLDAMALHHAEPRLGIALEARSRRPIDGLLYQTRHLRLEDGISVGMVVHGLEAGSCPALPAQGMARLGGEGRLAAWQRQGEQALPAIQPGRQKRLMLCLLTSARFAQGWLPDGFERDDKADHTVWRGALAGQTAQLVCAVTGKPQREGGWDLARHQPRELQARVAAGSCYFFEFDTPEAAQAAALALNGTQMGQDTEWGGGQVAVGLW